MDFIAKLASLAPKPRVNLTRFHGVLAPNNKRRALVTPAKLGTPKAGPLRGRLKRVFGIDVETCRACGGTAKVIACIEDPVVIKMILTHIDAQAPMPGESVLPDSRTPP